MHYNHAIVENIFQISNTASYIEGVDSPVFHIPIFPDGEETRAIYWNHPALTPLNVMVENQDQAYVSPL